MGCIFCQPILSDTSIIAHTKVYRYVYQRNNFKYQNGAPGILYTDGKNITYEVVRGDKRACCKCRKESYPVSAIKNIQILNSVFCTTPEAGTIVITLEVDGSNASIMANVDCKDPLDTFPQTLARLSGASATMYEPQK